VEREGEKLVHIVSSLVDRKKWRRLHVEGEDSSSESAILVHLPASRGCWGSGVMVPCRKVC